MVKNLLLKLNAMSGTAGFRAYWAENRGNDIMASFWRKEQERVETVIHILLEV